MFLDIFLNFVLYFPQRWLRQLKFKRLNVYFRSNCPVFMIPLSTLLLDTSGVKVKRKTTLSVTINQVSFSCCLPPLLCQLFFPWIICSFSILFSCFIACSSKEVIEASPVSMNGMHFFKEKCLQLYRHFSFLIVCKHLFSVYCKTLDLSLSGIWKSVLSLQQQNWYVCKDRVRNVQV